MLFCSAQFAAFFAVVFLAYWALPWRRPRVWLLLAASFYFYACWNHWLALLVGLSTAGDYLLARGMDATAVSWRRRALLGVSLVGNLGLLCYFKYANFFLRSLEGALGAAGASASLPVLRVILPVGISFYTFEAINYTVDVYRRKVPAERDLGNFLLFITFFPHLVAGPIVRARDFLPQARRPKRWSWPRAQLGLQLFVLGLLKKLAVADRMALFTDPVFASPGQYSTGATWLAVLGYALQIYCDFSGYSDMALGCAHLLGYKLARNFDLPYLSANVSEFWRRWHISLSTWLRDYLFIPLGGSRGGRWRTCRNLLLTM
ncbi:MAG TPA: MBOAT family O-acyltransferase, partial [Gemmataceae bacterium]|nr:MBOAT family O-acyltransferase [Gemmataceae bacterium]